MKHYRRVAKKKPQFTKQQERSLKDILKEAKKWQDVTLADFALTPTMTNIVPTPGTGAFYYIAQTDAEDNNRNGETIRGTTLDIRCSIKSRYSGTTYVRLMLVQFDQRTASSINDVLDSVTPPAGLTYSAAVVDSFRKINPDTKYKVLWDKKIVLNKEANQVLGGIDERKVRIYHKLTPSQSKMTYDSAAATSPLMNPIYLFACYEDNSGSPGNAPTLQYTGRLRYIDV